MSTQNDLINYQNVIKEANSLINEQIKLWGGVVSSIQKVGKVTPSSFVNAQKQVNEALTKTVDIQTKLDDVEKKRQATAQQILNTSSSISKQRIDARNKEVQNILTTGASIEKQRQKELVAEQKAQALLERSENVYNKVQQKVNQLTATYNNLATRKELGRKLTDQELAQLNSLEDRLNRYNEVLKKVDAQIGNNRRNVGNYASGFNGLGNSINQITRELPAFAFSAQTGFLALSNNLPILADEIQRVSANVKEMRAQGQQVPSVMSQILTSFLSWQTALSIGVTLITVYGKEIGNFFAEMFKGSKVIDVTKESLKAYVEVLKGSEFKNAYENVANVNIAFRQAREGVISKEKALKIYNDTLGDTLGETKSFEQAEKTFIAQARNYVEATLAKEQANILLKKSSQLASENFEVQTRTALTWGEHLKGVIQTGGIFGQLWSSMVGGSDNVVADKILSNRAKLIEKNVQSITKYNTEAEKLIGEFYKLSEGLNFDTNTNSGSSTSGTKNDKLKQRLDEEYRLQVARINQMEDGTAKELDLLQAWYEYQQKLHKDNATELLITQLDYWTKLKKINDDNLKKQQNDKEEADKLFIDEQDKLFKEDEENTKNYNESVAYWDEWRTNKALKEAEEREEIINRAYESVKGFASGVDFGTLGFSSLDFLNDLETISVAWESGLMSMQEKTAFIMKAIQGIMTDVFNQMSERQNAYFEQQFKNLETEKDLALEFAGENTAGREAIEQQYDEKKRALQMEQAKREKRMAIAQANINIASAILGALATQPVWVGIAMAALVGVLGAVQLANIASTPLPQFYTGTSNAPEGLALTQERGAEMITDKHGNIKTLGNNKGSQLTYLNKGDKVFTADETTQKLNELLISSGVSPIVNVSGGSGMSKEDMREVLNDTLAKQPKNSIIFDENGIKAFTSKENRRTILKNRNVKI